MSPLKLISVSIFLLMFQQIVFVSCESGSKTREPSWRIVNNEDLIKKGFRKVTADKLSIFIPDYMTPTDTGERDLWRYDALSKGEYVSIRLLRDTKQSDTVDLDKVFSECKEIFVDQARKVELLEADSLILNGNRIRTVDYRALAFGFPEWQKGKLAVIMIGKHFYEVRLSKANDTIGSDSFVTKSVNWISTSK